MGQTIRTIECNTDVLPLGVQKGIAVVFYVPGGFGEKGVVAADADICAGEPVGAALAEEDVAGDDVLVCEAELVLVLKAGC